LHSLILCAIVDRMAANKRIPLLIISDAVSGPTGLGRIARDLAFGIHRRLNDVFRIATFGYGAPMDCRLGFPQITAEGVDDFVCPTLPEAWHNFAGDERGIVLCIWDPSRLSWIAVPDGSPQLKEEKYFPLRQWLENAPFEKWIYCPLDASGPNDLLTFPIMKTLRGFDRILAYSEWGRNIIERTISQPESELRNLDQLPHGIDGGVFSRSPNRALIRSVFPTLVKVKSDEYKYRSIKPDEVLIGIVATNQSRKDWALGIETVAILSKAMKVRLWIHTDTINRNWDIDTLLVDYALRGEHTMVTTGYLPDDAMAEAYSACDVTLGIGPEGFGFPIFESLFCGTPCVHGNYGGAPEHMQPSMLVEPYAFRYEGAYSQKRPVYRAQDFADAVARVVGSRADRPEHLDWRNLWPRWEAWFRGAAKDLEAK